MNQLTRRNFVKSLGLGAGIASLPSQARAEGGSQSTPDVPLPQTGSNENELPFRQIHLDFHTSALVPDVGQDFNPSEFAEVLKDAHVNSINIFAKCHMGMSYYPTKVGIMHPHLKFDLLGEMIEACHKQGIRTPIYITVMWDLYSAEHHSDWRVLDEEGRDVGPKPLQAGWPQLCTNTPYLDYVAAQSEEIAKNYEADGFWFDILNYPDNGCFCPYCMRGREKLGLDSTQLDVRQDYALNVLDQTMDRLVSAVRPYRPKALIYFNTRLRIDRGMRNDLKYFTHLEIESLPGGRWGYDYFAVMSRYARNLGLDYLGMTGRFHRAWGDFGTIRNQAALDYECFRMLAQAGKCSIGDQLQPRGKLVKPIYERIGKTYASVEEKEPWCRGAKAVTEMAFLSNARFVVSGWLTNTEKGAMKMLSQLHQQFDVLDADSDFTRYKLILLPDYERFDDTLLQKVQSYLAQGGKLILSHESGLAPGEKRFALAEIGVSYEGPSKYQGDKGDYLEALEGLNKDVPPMVQFSYEAGSDVTANPGTTVLARIWKPYFDRNYLHFMSHRQTAWDQPTNFAAVTQHGNVIYISFPIFESYALNSYAPLKLIVANSISRLLPEPLVKLEGPSTAEVTVTEQEGRRIVHLLHYPAERRTPDIDIVEDVIPLFQVKLALRTERRPQRVYLAPQRTSLNFDYSGGYARTVVPSVFGHQMVVFEV
jgi:Hypothetical glycosyl hydrolase 6/Beta-galactosidase trimerisation domain